MNSFKHRFVLQLPLCSIRINTFMHLHEQGSGAKSTVALQRKHYTFHEKNSADPSNPFTPYSILQLVAAFWLLPPFV